MLNRKRLSKTTLVLCSRDTYKGGMKEAVSMLVDGALYPLGVTSSLLDLLVNKLGTCNLQTQRSPVILVHGYGSIRSHFLLLHTALHKESFLHVKGLNYNPLKSSVHEVAVKLVEEVEKSLESTNSKQVHLVGHSMGGVVVRYAVEVLGLGEKVGIAVTIAAPHGGAPISQLYKSFKGFRFLRSALELSPRSELLNLIEEKAQSNKNSYKPTWLSFYSDIDIVVPGKSGILKTPGAKNMLIKGEGHISLLLSSKVVKSIMQELTLFEDIKSRESIKEVFIPEQSSVTDHTKKLESLKQP